MTDIATLGIEVNSKDVKRAIQTLDQLSAQAAKTEKSTATMGGSVKNAATKIAVATRQMRSDFALVTASVMATITATTALAGGTLLAIARQSSESGRELVKLAGLAGTTTQEFQKLAFASASVGIEQDKLSDIYKDTQDKIGDFLNTGGGPMLDFFEQVAPQVGVTAEQFRLLSGPDALQLYVDSLEKANLSQSEMTFFMEAIASDSTALLPILQANGKAARDLGDDFDNLGLVLSDLDISNLKEMDGLFNQVTASMGTMGEILTSELTPYVSSLVDEFEDVEDIGQQFRDTIDATVESAIWLAGGFADVYNALEVVGSGFKAVITTSAVFAAQMTDRAVSITHSFAALGIAIPLHLVKGLNTVSAKVETWVNELIDQVNSVGEKVGVSIDNINIGEFDTSSIESALDTVTAKVIQSQANINAGWEQIGDSWAEFQDMANRPPPSQGIDNWYKKVKDSIGKVKKELDSQNKDIAKNAKDFGEEAGRSYVNAYIAQFEAVHPHLQDLMDTGREAFDEQQEAMGLQAEGTNNLMSSTIQLSDAMRTASSQGSSAYRALTLVIEGLQAAQGISAILNQAQGDSYTAFGRMAAMAAIVASLGVKVAGSFSSGGGGSGNSSISQELERGSGKGRVLGDSSKASESIVKAVEITAKATDKLVGINSAMLNALRSLQEGISGAATLIARAGTPDFQTPKVDSFSFSEDFGLLNPMAELGLDFVGSFIDGILGGKVELKEQGVRIIGDDFTSILEDASVQAFARFRVKKNAFSSTKTKFETEDLDDSAQQQFQLVFESIADTVTAGATALGLTATQVELAFNQFELATASIDLKDMDPEEQVKALTEYFSSVLDDATMAVLGGFIPDFQQAGESAGETLARMVTTVEVTNEVFRQLGVNVESLPLPISEAGRELLSVRESFIQMSGGIEEFISKQRSFVSNFASADEQFEILESEVTRAFNMIAESSTVVNGVLPATRDEFYALATSLDVTTAAGAEAYIALLNMSDAANDLYDSQDQRLSDEQAILDSQLDMHIQYLEAVGREEEALALRRQEALKDLGTEQEKQLQQNIWAVDDATAAENDRIAALEEQERINERFANSMLDLQERLLRAQGDDMGALILGQQRELQEVLDDPEFSEGQKGQLASTLAEIFVLEQNELQKQINQRRDRGERQPQRREPVRREETVVDNSGKILDDALKALKASVDAEKNRIEELYDAEMRLAGEAFSDFSDILNESMGVAKNAISGLESMVSSLDSAISQLLQSPEIVEISRQQAKGQVNSAINLARSGGDISSLDLSGAASRIANIDSSRFSSAVELAKETAESRILLQTLKDEASSQLTIEEAQLKAFEDELQQAQMHHLSLIHI